MPMSPAQPNSTPAVEAAAENPSNESSSSGSASRERFTSQEFSSSERALLLRLAHDSISSALEHREISPEAPTAHLAQHRGAFTSLYLRGELRGCVGYVLPACSVYRAVAETARAAAFDDNRFPPVSAEEAPLLEIELSILTPPQAIRAEEIQVGRHGLLLSGGGRRGLLLPQVPVEHGWDATTFLEQTCRKAGLPLDACRRGASIEAFTAEIFSDKKLPAPDPDRSR
jgi:AmmeMemoRadiSam system protein A